VATIFRDLESLEAEHKMEQGVMELPRTGTA